MALPTNVATPTPGQALPTNIGTPSYEVEQVIGFGMLFPDGTDDEPSIGFAEDADGTGTGFYRPAANTIRATVNGVDSLQITAGGITLLGAGAVTQATNKATTVELNAKTGAITMNNAALNAATIVSFTLTNSLIAATDVLVLNHLSGGTVGSYTLNAQCGAGSATINVRNNTAGSLSEAIVIQFALIKGAA